MRLSGLLSGVFPRLLFSSLLCGFILAASFGMDDDDDEHYGPRSGGAEAAKTWTSEMQVKYADNEDVLVLPGLVANRKTKQVQVLVEATGLPAGDTPEFILIDQASSHGYEALFWSMAKPSDVHQALVFIGLESGGSINPAALRFWAQGDPVRVLIDVDGGAPIPIENTIFDSETGSALAEDGYIFAGSVVVTLPDTGDMPHYGADVYDPRSILPLFNDPVAVLDIPRQAQQGEVYGRYKVNPDYAFDHGQMVTVLMEPASPNGRPARLAYRLLVTTTNESSDLVFDLRTLDRDTPVMASSELTPVLERMVRKENERQVVQVKLDFDATIPVGGLGRLCRLLAVMETFNQVRIDPPQDGQLYYRAFVPAPQWRTPEGRPVQPWELHLDLAEDAVSAKLLLHERIEPSEADDAGGFRQITHNVGAPSELQTALIADAVMREAQGRMQLPAVMLVFADAALDYGRLMEYVQPILETHGTVYIFAEEEEKE